jgi:hypothetical protein
MDANLLSPLLGRLIDRAKAAALEASAGAGEAEGVALLLADDTVVAAGAAFERPGGAGPAAERALAEARAYGNHTIEAAAVAIAGVQRESLVPSAASQEALSTVDAALPLVLKVHGRWVVRLLNDLPAECE